MRYIIPDEIQKYKQKPIQKNFDRYERTMLGVTQVLVE